MKRATAFLVFAATLFLLIPVRTKTQNVGIITIRLSYKVVLNPADGTRPPGVTNADINTAVDGMNDLMSGYLRGYRFQVTEIQDIGGMSNPPVGPSQWYNTNFFDADNGSNWKKQMEAAAIADPAYLWRNNAINLYLTNGICGGICSFPEDAENIIIIGGCSDNNPRTQLHEIGHYFSLCHTQGCPCGCASATGTGVCNTSPGDDGIAETLPDLSSWNQNQIANNSFGQPYASLNPGQQNQVDNVFFNLMSYHGASCGQGATTDRLTEQQLDRWSQSANVNRVGVRTGRMIFAEAGAPPGGNGSPANPFNTIAAAVTSANSDPNPDIIILRPGSFNEPLLTAVAVTFRTTRNGASLIGSSSPPAPASAPNNPNMLRKVSGPNSHAPTERLGFAGSGKK